MKTRIDRREFIGRFLPPVPLFQETGRLLKWVFYLFGGYLFLRLVAGLTFEGWKTLGLLTLRFVVPAFAVVWLVSRICDYFRRRGSARFLAGLEATVKTLAAACLMALGAWLYALWLRNPEEAAICLAMVGLMSAIRSFKSV